MHASTQVALVSLEGHVVALGSCPANLSITAAYSTLPSYSTGLVSVGDKALNNCYFSRLQVLFPPGSYQVRSGSWQPSWWRLKPSNCCLERAEAGCILLLLHRTTQPIRLLALINAIRLHALAGLRP
jgi:hypothetical protein